MAWTSGVESWGLSPQSLESVRASDLSETGFTSDFVDHSRPICVRGATAHWTAFKKWSDQSYLQRKIATDEIKVHRDPVYEMKWRRTLWPKRFKALFDRHRHDLVLFSQLRERASANEFVFAYAVDSRKSPGLASLADDVGNFEFLGSTMKPHYYEPLRYFLHGRSYTDWHYHPYDETLMCQFGASKTVTLLPPTQANWDVLIRVAEMEPYLGRASTLHHPELRTLDPVQVHVDDGDALYIPPHWWHAVECHDAGGGLGVTLAYCWRSPAHVECDPRAPYKKFAGQHGTWKRRAKLAAERLSWAAMRLGGHEPLTIY